MFQFPRATPFVRIVLITLGVAYVLQIIAEVWLHWPATAILALSPHTPLPVILLQVVAHPLVNPVGPDSVLRVAINLLFLWWALSPFEMRYGPRRVAQLCAAATLGASAAAIVAGAVSHQDSLVAGAGEWLLASIAGFAYSLPKNQQLSFFGVVPLKPMHLIWVLVAFSVLNFLLRPDVVNLAADLAAIGIGMGFVAWMRRPRTARKPRKSSGGLRVIRGGSGEDDPPKYLN